MWTELSNISLVPWVKHVLYLGELQYFITRNCKKNTWFLYKTLPYFPTFHKEIQSPTWHRKLASWWFRPISKISIKSDDFAQYPWTIKSKKKWNHHLTTTMVCNRYWNAANVGYPQTSILRFQHSHQLLRPTVGRTGRPNRGRIPVHPSDELGESPIMQWKTPLTNKLFWLLKVLPKVVSLQQKKCGKIREIPWNTKENKHKNYVHLFVKFQPFQKPDVFLQFLSDFLL